MPPEVDAEAFSPDIVEFITLLERHRVRYLVVGGEAVIFYGHIRLTGDIDFFYDSAPENIRRLHDALAAFWRGAVPGVKQFESLAEERTVVQFGLPPNRIDLLNTIDGVTFGEAWERRTEVVMVGLDQRVVLHLIGLIDLIANKRASGRPKDLDDLRFLEAALSRDRQRD